MGKRRIKFACDLEATTDPFDCRVWAWGYMEIGNIEKYRIGTDFDEFMTWLIQSNADLFFHNIKYDGSFIINWLLRNGFKHSRNKEPGTFDTIIVDKMGVWYNIDITMGYRGKTRIHTNIFDSLKKLPFKIKEIAKSFHLPILKGEIDYDKPRPVGYQPTKEEISYIKNDLEILARALDIQFKQDLTRMTIGSDALGNFKAIINKKTFDKLFPVVTPDLNENFRLAYKGGFTWLNPRFKEKDIDEGMVFDVNSLYPSQMYSRPLPYGLPIYFKGEYQHDPDYPLYIIHVKCDFKLKEGKIPTIQIKGNPAFKENEYLTSSNYEYPDLYLTNVDWELMQEHYELYDVDVIEGWKFKSKTGLFKQYIDKWTYLKNNSEGAIRQIAKLMLNNLYGKFATNPDSTRKEPYLKEDQSLGFRKGEKEIRDPVYTPMGAFITAWARYTTITTAQKCYDRIIYCDTDSIHITGTEVPEAIKNLVHPKKLGYWAWEYTFKRARYLRQKTYINDIYVKRIVKDGEIKWVPCEPNESEKTQLIVKCAGMPEQVKKHVTWENFHVGFTYGYDPITGEGNPAHLKDSKLIPKQVPGGVVLMPTIFTINPEKERKSKGGIKHVG